MSEQIFASNGTLEKFIGDAMVATFGILGESERDASDALCCAERMLAALATWNDERRAEGLPAIAVGIGLNYGPVVLGDLGNKHGMSFTVIGDTVNTASRLQDATRSLGTPLVVSDELVQKIGEAPDAPVAVVLRRLQSAGEQHLRGRASSIKVWTLDKMPPQGNGQQGG
jgi:adenylate cyclase